MPRLLSKIRNRLLNFGTYSHTMLSLRSYHRLLFMRPNEIYSYSYPLMVISGMQRSGTTLMTQLLRNHPEVLTFGTDSPEKTYSELIFGQPNKYYWPDLAAHKTGKARFDHLIPMDHARHHLRIGDPNGFLFDFGWFKKLFLRLDREKNNMRQRDVFDSYFTAYFNAFLNYSHSNYFDRYRFISASIPGFTRRRESIAAFFQDYPDGKMLAMIRDPLLWLNSAKGHSTTADNPITYYRQSLENCLEAREKYPENFLVVSFDDLLRDPVASVQKISAAVGLTFNEVSVTPSRFPHYAMNNSNFGQTLTTSVSIENLTRNLDLDEFEIDQANENLSTLYRDLYESAANRLHPDQQ